MNGPVTIDASVFVSAFTPSEPAHPASRALLLAIRQSGVSVLLPTLAIVEIAAAIGRGQRRPDLGYAFALEVGRLPQVTLIGLDERLAQEAADIAAHHRLRGSDAIYAAVARRFATVLITPVSYTHL
ncbi:MAG: PIN domain-containing protein, partial [Anaerolineae bacterium]|nr:PIN domain-containing protein [Anaerolineae bacterium]